MVRLLVLFTVLLNFQQPSPVTNGSYSSPGSVTTTSQGTSSKGKLAQCSSRVDSRDVIFPPTTGQGGPPPQIPAHMPNNALGGARMDTQMANSTQGPSKNK